MTRSVTIDQGRRALMVAAQLVDLYGEIYLPLFERLEEGLIELERRGAAVDRAREMVRRASEGALPAPRPRLDRI